MKYTNEDIIKILHSIKGVRLDKNNEVEILFDPPSTTYPDRWEPNAGFKYGSFTRELLLLIEYALNGKPLT